MKDQDKEKEKRKIGKQQGGNQYILIKKAGRRKSGEVKLVIRKRGKEREFFYIMLLHDDGHEHYKTA